ncbi:hypothetical protein ZIOFF_010566 [Zingiber officinale]|uniref:Uncharacterized protein n=1 Tax=Zingiber officinale TaxID=94328 RepID=A0A8J5LS63_ZINOF|nr:hypothetical protein ZIOFF_010566 [Zingiber officinale]
MRHHQNLILSEDESRSKSSSFSSEFSGGKSTPRLSSGASFDVESLIQGAIVYYKKSSQWAVDSEARRSMSNADFYLLSTSKIAPKCKQAELTHQIRSSPSCCCFRGEKSNFCDAYLLLKHESNAIKDFILVVSVNK